MKYIDEIFQMQAIWAFSTLLINDLQPKQVILIFLF